MCQTSTIVRSKGISLPAKSSTIQTCKVSDNEICKVKKKSEDVMVCI